MVILPDQVLYLVLQAVVMVVTWVEVVRPDRVEDHPGRQVPTRTRQCRP